MKPEMNVSVPLRMQLHFGFGLMPAYTMSPVEPAKAALAKALTLAEQIGDLQAQFQILGACGFSTPRAANATPPPP